MTIPVLHMDCDGFSDALADYLESDCSVQARQAVELHAASCTGCGQLLHDLGELTASAAALPALTPSRDLWSGIAERIDTRVITISPVGMADLPKRRRWLVPAVAAAALVVTTAGITNYLTRQNLAAPRAQQIATTGKGAEPSLALPVIRVPDSEVASIAVSEAQPAIAAPAKVRLASARAASSSAEPVFSSEIAKLRLIVKERRRELDPATIAILDQSVAVIDSAIAQSRAALVKDPASGFLASQLNRSLDRKVELLRTAAALPART